MLKLKLLLSFSAAPEALPQNISSHQSFPAQIPSRPGAQHVSVTNLQNIQGLEKYECFRQQLEIWKS